MAEKTILRGPGGYPVVVMGPTHVPMMVYVPERHYSHEGAMRFLAFSGLFTPGTTYAATTILSGTVPTVVSVPPQDHLLTVLYPTPGATTTWLQLSVEPDVALHNLGLPVRRGMELVFPPRLTHATVLQERVASGSSRPQRRDPADMSLLQLKAQILQVPGRSDDAVGLASHPEAPRGIPTPLGRRVLQSNANLARGDSKRVDKLVQRLDLSALVQPPAPAITV